MLSRPSLRSDRGGGVAMAMLVLMIVTLLAGASLATGARSLSQSRLETAGSRASAAGELAISEAIAEVVGGAPGSFTLSGVVDGVSYQADAALVGADSWVIYGAGDDADITRAFEITLDGATEPDDPVDEPNVFAGSAIDLRNNEGTVTGIVGTNGSMNVTGSSVGTAQHLYGPSASCTGCANPVSVADPYPVPTVTMPTGTTQSCPNKGKFNGNVNGGGGVPYVCRRSDTEKVEFKTTHVANGPLIVYVDDRVEIDMENANINSGGPVSDFSLYYSGDEQFKADKADVIGTLIAPAVRLTAEKFDIVGTLVVDRLDIDSGGKFNAAPDPDAGSGGGGGTTGWTLGVIRSVPTR